jgi:hypothetical protein
MKAIKIPDELIEDFMISRIRNIDDNDEYATLLEAFFGLAPGSVELNHRLDWVLPVPDAWDEEADEYFAVDENDRERFNIEVEE